MPVKHNHKSNKNKLTNLPNKTSKKYKCKKRTGGETVPAPPAATTSWSSYFGSYPSFSSLLPSSLSSSPTGEKSVSQDNLQGSQVGSQVSRDGGMSPLNMAIPAKSSGGKKRRCKTSKKTNAVKGNK